MIRSRIQAAVERTRDVPYIVWVMLGFVPAYIWFFLWPVFFSGPVMNPLRQVLPIMSPIGADFREQMGAVQRLFIGGTTPYTGTVMYPPLSYVLFGPLLFLGSHARYVAISVITLVSYVMSALVFPLGFGAVKKTTGVLILVLTTGLTSYGLQFELERGQFNMIAVFLAYWAIWIFHRRPERRLWAYLLFCLSVQLKIYPFVFIVMFVQDWHDWKNNIRRLGLLSLANAGFLIVLGPATMVQFVQAVGWLLNYSAGIRFDNSSIYSFANLVTRAAAASGYAGLAAYTSALEAVLFAFVGLCLFLILISAYRRRSHGMDRYMLLACAIASLVIPTVSHDYKLTLLAGPAVLFLWELERRLRGPGPRFWLILAVLGFCMVYSATLFSPGYKLGILLLQSNFPALMIMLLLDTLAALSLTRLGEDEDAPEADGSSRAGADTAGAPQGQLAADPLGGGVAAPS